MPESKERKATEDKLAKAKVRKAAETKKAIDRSDDPKVEKQRLTKAPGTRRWVAPAFITVGLLGVIWLVVYYIAGRDVPVMNKLGDWNILIGMGLMAIALGLSMLWK